MRLKIGLDIDGVVADSFTVFRQELNRHYRKEITQIDQYDMTKVYDVAWEDLSKFFDDHMVHLFSSPKPMQGAVESICTLLEKGHEITYITARKSGNEEKVTRSWFEAHGIPIKRALFVGAISKTFAIKEFEIDIFVEDYMANALEIASIGIPVLLLDAPYNQGNVPKGVTRCCSWKEIMFYINEYRKMKEDSP